MKKISKATFETLKRKKIFLVDMRSPVQYRDGHVAGAVNLSLRNFVNAIMPMDKSTHLVLYSNTFDDADLALGVKYAKQIGFSEISITEYKIIK